MFTSVLVSAGLVSLSLLLVGMHWRTWLQAKNQVLLEADMEFAWRQFRRRVLASGLLGIVGVAVFGGEFVQMPVWVAVYWGSVLLVVMWIFLLAVFDAASTRAHFLHIQQQQLSEQKALQAEVSRLQQNYMEPTSHPRQNGRTHLAEDGQPTILHDGESHDSGVHDQQFDESYGHGDELD